MNVYRRSIVVIAAAVFVLSVTALPQARQAGKVLVGWCTSFKNVETAKAAGFDYVELSTTEITNLPDADYEAAVAQLKKVGLPTPVANLFIPGTMRLTGPEIDREQQMAYVKKAFARMARLGTTIIVFGSGGARRFPDGFPKQEAMAQLVEFAKRIAPEARAQGITIAVEPLRRQESNIINSAAEGFEWVKAVNDPNFQLMIDFYHLASESEDPAIIQQTKGVLRHLHMANPQGRVFPLKWEEYDYTGFFANLRTIGYTARISIEASSKDVPTEAPQSIALLRRAFEGTAGRSVAAPPAAAPPAPGAPALAVASTPAAPAQNPPAGRGGAPGGATVGPRPNVGPANRPLVDPAAVERGRVVWSAECVTCHGAMARGTDTGPSVLRSLLFLRDRQGSEMGPFLKKGHPTQSGKPSASLTEAQVADVSQFIRQRLNDTLRGSPLFTAKEVVVGDAAAGAAYFNGDGKCTTCHSTTGDLAGIAGRIPSPVDLQQRMVFPVRGRGRGAAPTRTAIAVTITPATGAPMTGVLVDEDDFFINYRDAAGVIRVVRRTPGMKVAQTDPLREHQLLLDRLTDKHMHDLVAYLVTLK